MKTITRSQSTRLIGISLKLALVACLGLILTITVVGADEIKGFSFDCDNTLQHPCRKLVAQDRTKPIRIESSSAAWSPRYQKVIVVSDNYNDLSVHDAVQYVIAYFDPVNQGPELVAKPLLTPKQAEEFRLFDLEGVTLDGDRLYAIGSLALHGKDPERDRWERN